MRDGLFDHPVGQLVQQDAVAVGEFTDLGAAETAHRDARAAVPPDLVALLGQQIGQPGHLRAPDRDLGVQPGAAELGDRLIGHQAALVERDHPVGQYRGLLRRAGGDQDGATGDREGA
ncbi:hypothetical protein ACFQ0T_12305 [Kitasatospora gansuensis]